MRLAFVCLALTACSSDPCQDASCRPNPPVDSGAADTGALADLGRDVLALDITEDRPAPIDLGATDAMADVLGGDCTGNPRVCTCPDGGLGTIIDCVTEWCTCPQPDAGSVDAPSDVAEDRRATDVPADARINCAGKTTTPCRSSAECASLCLPPTGVDAMRWCCIGGGAVGECGETASTSCSRP